MTTRARFLRGAAALLAIAFVGCQTAPPVEGTSATPELVAFASDEGLARLGRSGAHADFAALANQFEAQSNIFFCGPTSAAIVLNSVYSRSPALPRDGGRLRPEDLRSLTSGAAPVVPRWTQDNVIDKGEKTRAQVFGEPMQIQGKAQPQRDFGYQLRQFDEMLRANGLRTRMVVVKDARSEASVRDDLVRALERSGAYAIVNYRRETVGQMGGGHISPLGAYDAGSDSFLVLDVNPAAAGWVWMPTATLARGMRTFDTVENRGYIIVEAP